MRCDVWLRRRRIPLMPSQDSRLPSKKVWPATGLNVQSLREDGWKAQPFQQFILKLHGRCNLSCTYCYVYEMADQSWEQKPKIISVETVHRVAERIAEHAMAHRLAGIEVILHGGEPLLCGGPFIDDVVSCLRTTLPAETTLSVRLQTNGTLLIPRTLD